MKIRIWGARGSTPAPLKPEQVEEKICRAIFGLPELDTGDQDAVRAYVGELPPLLRGTAGGNTSCVEIRAGEEILIVDAGTGLRELGLELLKGPCGRGQGTLHLFISHPHWDHIQGFPFFIPAFIPGNRIFIYGIHDIETVFEDQQRSLNFPVPLSYMQAEREFISLQVGQPFSIGQVRVHTIKNAHPGGSYAYRFEDQHSVFVYASDAEFKQLDDVSVQPHIAFFKNADALVFDTQYTLRESWQKIDWGHSSAMLGVDLARAAGVKKLILFHHDPSYSDAELQKIQADALDYQSQDTSIPTCEVLVAYEGLTLDLTPPGAITLQHTSDGKIAILTPFEHSVDQLVGQLTYLTEQDVSTSPIIDLSQVERLTTASLKSLVSLRHKGEDAPLVLVVPSKSARMVIKLAGYMNYFATYPSLEAALAAVQIRETLGLPGQVIKGRYQIEDKVAVGWLGTVLKATDIHLDYPVAIKVLSPTFSEETVARFMSQTQQVIALDHRNIVQAFAWSQDEGHTFVVEELMTGSMLHDLLEDTDAPLPASQAMDIALDIAHALEYAHNRGVVLGDLKPRNVFLSGDEGSERLEVKLSGFGLWRLEQGRNLLEAPLLFLAAPWLAPEQILGQTLDARTDLYALGVILYQMFTGSLPFEGADQKVMQAHLRQSPRPPRELSPRISRSLEHVILKLLSKNPNDRYASAQQVRRVLGNLAVGAKETLRQRQRLLVGREKPTQILRACWEEARAGRGQLAFVAGEPGIGKTHLAQQAAAQCHPPVLLIGHCEELERSTPYALFTEALRAYLTTVPPELFDEKTRQLLGNLSRLVPGIRRMLPGLPEPPSLEPRQEQLRLMDSLTRLIQRATQERPWFLILDDLQWADQSSLELLRHLGRHLPAMALFIIGVYRDVELEQGHPLRQALRDLSSYPTYQHIPLGRLDRAEVVQVLDDIWRQPAPTALGDKIYEHTAGNPFYVQEVAKGLVDDGLITLQEGKWHFAPLLQKVRLPPSIHDTVWGRIGHLSQDTQALLRQAAVLGQTFQLDDLREMSGLSEWQVMEHLDVALERQLVQEAPGEFLLRFHHVEIQRVLYDDLGPLRRRLLHHRASKALERRAQPEPERIAEQLAHHFGEAGEIETALTYGLEAARQAQAAYANDTSLLWYRRALEMLDQLGPEGAAEFQSLRLSAHTALGKTLDLTGQYDESLEHYALARKLVEAETSTTELARSLADLCRQTAQVYEKRSEYDTAFEWMEKGLSYLDEDAPVVEGARLYIFGAALHYRQSKYDEALAWCQNSLDIASQIETREGQQAIGRAHYVLSNVYMRRGDLNQAARSCHESIQVYQQVDDLVGQANAFNNLGVVYRQQGNWTQASDAYYKSLIMRQEIGDVYGQAVSANNLAGIYLNRGKWDQAQSLYEQAHTTWKNIGTAWGIAISWLNLAQAHIYQKNWSEARACLSNSQALFDKVGNNEFTPELKRRWGEFYLGTGELGQALEHTHRSVELAVELDSPLEEGISLRMLGKVHLARDEREPAEDALRASLEILNALDSAYEAAKTKLSLARLARETGSMDEAQAYLAQASETFARLGAQADLAQAQDLERQLLDELTT